MNIGLLAFHMEDSGQQFSDAVIENNEQGETGNHYMDGTPGTNEEACASLSL